MAQRDVQVRITSDFKADGFKAAERESSRLEAQQRRMAGLHAQASREMAANEARKADAIVAANRRQSEAMEAFGRGLTMVSLAAAAGLALTARSAMQWESAWAGVLKTTDATGDELVRLEADLRSMARALPASHTEIAAVAEAAGQLGVKAKDVAGFTRVMINLGETTNLSAEQAASSLAKFSNIMGVGANQAGRMGSAIVDLGNNAATTEADIVAMGVRIAGAGRTAGLTSAQVLGVASALSSVGVEAEAGGTAISRVMLQIDSDVKSGSDRLDRYARVAGVSAADFARAWEDDAAGALGMFIEGLGGLQQSGADTTAVLDDLGFAEIRVADTLRRTALAGDLVTESVKRGSDAWDENTALIEEANKRYQTTEARLQIARNQINDAAIDIGENLTPAVATGAEVIGNLATGFGALPEPVQRFVVLLGISATGVGLLGGAALMATPKLLAMKVALDSLHGGSSKMGAALGGAARILTGPVGLAIAGVGVALVGLTAIFGAHQKAQEAAREEAKALADTFDEQSGAMTDLTREWFINEAASRGYIDALKAMNIPLGEGIDALMGNADAQERVAAAAESARVAALNQSADIRENVVGAYSEWQSAVEWAGETIEGATVSAEDHESAMTSTADAVAAATGEFEDQASAIDALIDATNELNGVNQSAEAAYLNWKDQIAETTGRLAENDRTLDANSEAGRENRRTLLDMATTGQKHAEALLRQTGSSEKFRSAINDVRQNLFSQARQFFATEQEAWDYVDSLLAVPDDVTTSVHTPGMDAALSKAQLLASTVRGIPSTKTITFEQRTIGTGKLVGFVPGTGAPIYGDSGGVVEFYAAGGMREQHMATIATPGTTRVWNEPETGGEAYIPLAPSKRARSMDVLEQVAERFGASMGGRGSGPVVLAHESVAELASAILDGAGRMSRAVVDDQARAFSLSGRRR